MTPLQIALAVLGISFLIAWHELGHYLLARAFKMRVVRYALGIGPKILGVEHRGIQYQISAFPFGGFVQIFGMTPFEEGAEDDPRAFINQPRWQRIIVYAAGPGFNYALAVILFFFYFLFFAPSGVAITEVVAGSAAEQAHLMPGDIVRMVDDKVVRDASVLAQRMQQGDPATLVVQRDLEARAHWLEAHIFDGKPPELVAERKDVQARIDKQRAGDDSPVLHLFKVQVTPRVEDGRGLLGVRLETVVGPAAAEMSVWTVAGKALSACWIHSVATLDAFGRMFAGDDSVKLEGPLGIGRAITRAVDRGLRDFIWILALLSVTLGLLNLLPVPALDGIKILVLLVESVLRRDISPVLQLWVNGIGLLLLLALMIGMTVFDAADLMMN